MEKERIKVFAVKDDSKNITVNFSNSNKNMAEEYAAAMTARGYVVVKQYGEALQ